MDLWGMIGVIALVSIIAAKFYSVSKGKRGVVSTSQPANFGSSESDVEPIPANMNASEGKTKSAEAWDEGYLILIALVLCGPLGLILVWRTDRWGSNVKTRLTIGYLAIVLLLAALSLSQT